MKFRLKAGIHNVVGIQVIHLYVILAVRQIYIVNKNYGNK